MTGSCLAARGINFDANVYKSDFFVLFAIWHSTEISG